MAIHEHVDRLFGALSWLRQQRLDGIDNTHARMPYYEALPRGALFPAPPAIQPLSVERGSSALGIECQTSIFPSVHEPLHPGEISSYYARQAALHRFRVRRVRRQGPRARRACIYLHPWMAEGIGTIDLGVAALIARKFACDVYNLEQAHHGRRRLTGSAFSGAHFFSADVARTFESLRQAVNDARALARYLRATGAYDEVGMLGISLGGSIATICACHEPSLAWCIAVLAHIDIADAVHHAPIAAVSRRQLEGLGVSLEELARLNRALLSDWLAPVRAERLLLIAGKRDLCMRPAVVERQVERWPGVHCSWIEGGHITSLFKLGRHLTQARVQLDALSARARGESPVVTALRAL